MFSPVTNRTNAALLAGLILLALFYVAFCGISEMVELSGDASGYLLAAQVFSPFQASSPMLEAYSRDIIYPPLFPLLAGWLGGTVISASAVVIASALGAFVLLFWWLRSEGAGTVTAGAASLWFALMPITYVTTLNIWTENTGLLWTMAAVALVANAERAANPLPSAWWLAAAAVALATLTRVASVPLLAAFGLYLLMKRPRGFVAMGLLAALPFCAWALIAKSRQVGLGGYTSQWADLYQASWFDMLAGTARNWSVALAASWRDGFVGDVSGTPLPSMAAAIGVVSILGWLDRLWQRRFDAIYVLGYAAMLFAWPHPEESSRYGYVLLPFMVAYPVLLLQRLRQQYTSAARFMPSPAAFLCVAIAMVVPSLMVNIQRHNQPLPEDLRLGPTMDGWYSDDGLKSQYLTRFHLRVLAHLKTVAKLVPAEDCIFSGKPQVVALHTRRISVVVPISNVSDDEFDRRIQRCRFVHVINLSYNYRPPMYPLARLADRAKVVSVAKMNDGYGEHTVAALIQILPAPALPPPPVK